MQELMGSFFTKGYAFDYIRAIIGAYSLIAAEIFNNGAKVYAFEPSFPNFFQHNTNIQINQVQEPVAPVQIALSDKMRVSMSHHSTLELGSTMHLPGQALEHKADALTPVREPQLSSFSLDDINGHFNLAAPSHPKLDAD